MVAISIVGTVCLVAAPGAASAQPTNPADAQLSAAQQAKDAAAQQVGSVIAQLANAQAGAAAAGQAAQIALQDYQEREAAYRAAKQAAESAATAAATAAVSEQAGRAQVAAFARSSYLGGTTNPGMIALMTAGGPAQLVERAALLEAVGSHRADVVGQLTVLHGRADRANEAALHSVGHADTLKAQAGSALSSAVSQEVAARAQTAALAAQQKTLQAQLQQAQQTLAGLEGARAAQIYAAQQSAAQQAVAQAAAQQRAPAVSNPPPSTPIPTINGDGSSPGSQSPGGSPLGGSSSGGGPATNPPAVSGVQAVIAAAKRQLGVPYAWGGGGPGGRSMGFGPDAGVVGFDCSGLTQYAYARAGISISRVARDQYADFSDRSVASGNLQPGDLVFWANGNSYASIYHVALYIGSGNVIAAPQSGDVVKIEPMWFGSDYFGAVRPTG